MKKLLLVVFLFLIGCQKETELKTESNVKIHEIFIFNDSSSSVFWYIFFKDGKFIYTKSRIQMSDFSSTFFLSSKEIPKELKFSEDYIRESASDSVDGWGVEVVELQESPTDSVAAPDSVVTDSVIADSVGVDSLIADTSEFLNYEIGEKR